MTEEKAKVVKKVKKTAELKEVKEPKIKKVKVAKAVEIDNKAGEVEKEEPVVAKAGKRSEKGIKEADLKAKKIEAQKHADENAEKEDAKPRKVVKPARPKIERRTKKYKEAFKLIEKDKEYNLKDAVDLAKKTSTTKFDSTVELHVALGVDPKHADQNIRGTVSLPAGTGKEVKVAVFAEIEDAKKAIAAGADFAGNEEMITKLDKQDIDFDVLIATPKLMAKLGKYAKVLGPKGLMPNPKSGTVNADVAKAVTEAKAGKIEYRVDSNGIVHTVIGKVSFAEKDLMTNLDVVLKALKAAKPASVKASYFKSAFLTTSMGPSVKMSLNEIQ